MVIKTECNGQNKPCRMVWIEGLGGGMKFSYAYHFYFLSHRANNNVPCLSSGGTVLQTRWETALLTIPPWRED